MNRLTANLLAMSAATTMQAYARDFYSYGEDQDIITPIVANIVSGQTVEESSVIDQKLLGTGHFSDMYDEMRKNAPSTDVVNDDPVEPLVIPTNKMEHLKYNDLWGAVVDFDSGRSAIQRKGTQYIYTTGVGYLLTTSTLYTGDEDFKNYFSPVKGWTGSGVYQTVNAIDQVYDYSFTGELGTDVVCLYSGDYCVEDFQFMAMSGFTGTYSETTLQDYTGYLGFAPKNDQYDEDPIVIALQKAGTITDAVATFDLQNAGYSTSGKYRTSTVTVGEKIMNENNTRGMDITYTIDDDATQWAPELNSVQFGDQMFNSITGKAIIDSGSPQILLPEEAYKAFAAELVKAAPQFNCTNEDGTLALYCYQNWTNCTPISASMPALTFTLADSTSTKFTLPGEAYSYGTVATGNNFYLGADSKCSIAVRSWTGSDVVLGAAFMRNFVFTFDYTNLEMGVAVQLNAPKGICIGSDGKTDCVTPESVGTAPWTIFGICIGGLSGISLIGVIAFFYVGAKKTAAQTN